MALTEEQIKNLKPGDPLVIHTTFHHVDNDGDLWFTCPQIFDEDGIEYIHPKCVSMPDKPKHDPCRMFREGDIVKPRFVNGRTDNDLSFLQPYTVTKREDALGNVRVKNDNHSIKTKAVFLELVTPVEELEPYSIDPANTNVLFKCGKKFATFEDDDEAQELCDRLNEEYRKEQK